MCLCVKACVCVCVSASDRNYRSLLQSKVTFSWVSFAKETYNFEEPANRSHRAREGNGTEEKDSLFSCSLYESFAKETYEKETLLCKRDL